MKDNQFIVEYHQGSKTLGRLIFSSRKQFEMGDKVRKEFLRAGIKVTWEWYLKALYGLGIRPQREGADLIIEFLDVGRQEEVVENEKPN